MASLPLPFLLLGIALSGAAYAEEEALPELAFLEYLGMWDAADEEVWQVLDDDQDDSPSESTNRNDGDDPVPQGEEPQEFEDEH